MEKLNVLFLSHLILYVFLISCNFAEKNIKKVGEKLIFKNIETDIQTEKIMDSLVTLEIEGHWVDILSPQNQEVIGNILVFPGWDFSRDDWCKNSSLCEECLKKGYRLIMPEMGKSVYSAKFYPETRKDWQVYPTKEWVLKSLIPRLQKDYNILTTNQKNYLIGLSTGGRGVALIALAFPELFTGAAALSGDFEQTRMPQDNLMRGYYGEYGQFPERWEGEDNPTKQIALFKTPIYLGHGKSDNIVPLEQTIIFYEALKKANPDLKVKLNTPEAKHDYAYWDSEVLNMLDFFENLETEK